MDTKLDIMQFFSSNGHPLCETKYKIHLIHKLF